MTPDELRRRFVIARAWARDFAWPAEYRERGDFEASLADSSEDVIRQRTAQWADAGEAALQRGDVASAQRALDELRSYSRIVQRTRVAIEEGTPIDRALAALQHVIEEATPTIDLPDVPSPAQLGLGLLVVGGLVLWAMRR